MTCVTFLSAPTPFAVMTPTLLLAPMEGLLDATLRDVLTRTGGVDRCVSEFIRVTDTLLPERPRPICDRCWLEQPCGCEEA